MSNYLTETSEKDEGRKTKNKIKIVRIIARLNVGGPARHVVWLTGALQNEQFQSILLAGSVPKGEEDMSYFAFENSVTPIFIQEMSRELSLKDLVSLWKIYREICFQKPDIIHTHTAKAGTVGRVAGFLYRWLTPKTLIGKPNRVRLVHTYHGHVFHSYYSNLKTKIFLFIEKFLAFVATDRIIVITKQQLDEIHNRFGVGKRKQFVVIPLGIDLQPFENVNQKRQILREELGVGTDEILVGLVGRLTEIKNISMFLKVAALYKDGKNEILPPIKFVIIGEGHLRKNLESEAESLQIMNSVFFLGNRMDADVFYAGLDIVALTSLNEGTPLSLIEAMANGRAVISTEVGGVADLLGKIQKQSNGFKVYERGISVASNAADAFLAGLIYLADNAHIRKDLGANGKRFAVEEYSKERLTNDIKKLYLDLM